MMKARIIFLAATTLLVLFTFIGRTAGQSGNIVITGADATVNVDLAAPSVIPDVGPRFVVQFANAMRYYNMIPVPSALLSLIRQTGDKITIQYANTNRTYTFVYPIGLAGDTTPPQITDITSTSDAPGSATIGWSTNEFANSLARYGTRSGVYTNAVSDTLYYKRHEVVLIGLAPGTTYYYQVSSTDRDGNTATSSENSFVLVRANFTAAPTSGPAPLSVVFTNTSTGVYTNSSWNFGDGGTSTQASPTHIYSAFGSYTVTLTISGMSGMDTLTRTNYITTYEPVKANFTGSPTLGTPPLAVGFADSSTGPVATWEWAFGDGGASTLQHPTHIYMTGTYTVSLTVRAAGGAALLPGGTDTLTRPNYIRAGYAVYLPLILRNP
jgi:PKD repeat protein